MKAERFFIVILLAGLLFSVSAPLIHVRAQDSGQTQAQELLAQLTPEERVGQLFLVSFTGTDVSEESLIYDLVSRRHVGGVALLAGNDNFSPAPNTVVQAYDLISQLQTIEWQGVQTIITDPTTGEEKQASYIPLFVAISQEGDGYPNDQILNGLTPLPSEMALGATWQPALAEQVGTVAGKELSVVGFNLFLGPSLDVLESPSEVAGGGFGTSVFGGDPYWVGEMGRAYIAGLHKGSNGHMLVIAKHFPGQGGSDRPAEEEVSTIRKSLEQLKQIELAPFFAVTGNAPSSESAADGLLVSHIRYQGFQGNIRATTKPVSLDPQALKLILDLPAFASWRQNGGLMVSDDLGTQAVRRFYDPAGTNFVGRRAALDAFLAGNDLLYLGNIVSSDQPDNYQTILKILEFFAQKYREDPAFAQRVDDSVLRILTYKYHLYDHFDLNTVIPPEGDLNTIGQSQAITFQVAQQAATLINPDVADLDAVLPAQPNERETILFLTDTRPSRQCSTCLEEPMLSKDALRNAVLDLYGPGKGGQVNSTRLKTYSFDELSQILENAAGLESLETSLRQASWVVISMLDSNPNTPQGIVLRRFLSERQDLLRSKRVITFAFEAPYYLDATDISKLTAYYSLFSKSAASVEVAARLLFREISPPGALPVSVRGINYDLLSITTPDPVQEIELFLDLPPVPTAAANLTPEPTSTPSFRVGDTISVRTGVIRDHNQHPVPDGTGVRFTLMLNGESSIVQQADVVTTQGMARTSFRIDRTGLLEIRATSEPATNSVVLQLDVPSEGVITVVAPATETPPLPTSTSLPTVQPTPEEIAETPLKQGHPDFSGWLLMVLILGGTGYPAFWIGRRFASLRWGLRWAACTILGGLAAYNYLALGLPGSVNFVKSGGLLGISGVSALGAAVGAFAGWLWWRTTNAPKKQAG